MTNDLEATDRDLERYWRRAESGDTQAMFDLCMVLIDLRRPNEAAGWLRRAAEAGHVEAMCNLGVLLTQVDPADEEAEQWLARAAATGDLDSMNNLGSLLRERGRHGEAEPWLRRAATAGHADAMYNLGLLLEEAGQGAAGQGAAGQGAAGQGAAGHGEGAVAWYLRAAEAGQTDAMVNLGGLLIDAGRAAEGERWWRRAANAGDPNAMVNLGELCVTAGRPAEAGSWYHEAAAAGDRSAARWLLANGLALPPGISLGPPSRIAINPDDHYAEHVGHTADGRQFFLTTPFVPADDISEGEEFVALYLFDRDGQLIEARIDSFGPRARLDEQVWGECYDRRLRELGELGAVRFDRIEVAPFAVERYGTTFGLVPQPPKDAEDADEGWWVELQPGNYMAFHEPWDSGEYDT